MEEYATYEDYVAAMQKSGLSAMPKSEFEATKTANTDFTLTNTNIVENPNEILGDTTGQLGDLNIKDPVLADTGGLNVTSPTPSANLGQIDANELAKTRPNLGTMDAAQGTFTGAINLDDVTGTVSEGAIAQGVTEELDPRATTSYQLADLFKSIEDGNPLPPWASPAVRKVSSLMNARGVGASSMGAAAMTQAIMESGITIAAQDAKAYSQIQLVNLTNKQKAAMQNALVFAQMDQLNANNRTKAAIANAQAFLTMDIKNLDNQQKTNMINFQADMQALFTDTAAENARVQFNAKNEIQIEEFFAQLDVQVQAANKNRESAMRQFNVSQTNAMEQFRIQTVDSRDKFNGQMKFAVDQSNAQWRRQINTTNTATQNETNRINVQNTYNASQAAQNFLWQKMRDNAQFNFQKNENFLQRQHEIGLLAMEFANSQSLYNQKQKDLVGMKIGEWLANWIVSAGTED